MKKMENYTDEVSSCTWKDILASFCFIAVFATVAGLMIFFNYYPRDDLQCYRRLGCFELSGSWMQRPRAFNFFPQSPTMINTSFIISSMDPRTGQMETRRIRQPFRYPTSRDFRWGQADVVFFVVHGYTDHTRSWMQSLQKVLLSLGDVTVVLVDWEMGADGYYPQVVANTRVVAREISTFIRHLVRREFNGRSSTTPRKRFHLIGHSLGAQISSYVGKAVRQPEGTIYQITALDPAFPLFEELPQEIRLHRSDARHVLVIHSNAGPWGLGMNSRVGTVDIYLNDGRDQRGCVPMKSIISRPLQLQISGLTKDGVDHVKDLLACSHRRVYEVLEDILKNLRKSLYGKYVAYPVIIAQGAKEITFGSIDYSFCQINDACWELNWNMEDYYFQLPSIPTNFVEHSTIFFMPTTNQSPFCSRFGYLEILICPSMFPNNFQSVLNIFNVTISHIVYGEELPIYEGRINQLQKIKTWIDLPCDSPLNEFNNNAKFNIFLSVSFQELREVTTTESSIRTELINRSTRTFCWSKMKLTYYDHLQKELVKLKPCSPKSSQTTKRQHQQQIHTEMKEPAGQTYQNAQCFEVSFATEPTNEK